VRVGNLINKFNYLVGRTFHRLGYRFDQAHRYPRANLNLLRIGVLLYLAKGKSPLHLVQIGAYDGKESDPINGLLELPNIRAIIVEPQREPFQKLFEKYEGMDNICLERSMIGSVDGTSTLYLPENIDHSQLASSDRQHLHKFGYADAHIREVAVNSLTPKSLLDKYSFASVDVLQIDAEGGDFSILKQFIELGIEPGIINLESYHLTAKDRSEMYLLLSIRNYSYVDHNLDTFFVKDSLLHA